MARRRNRSRGFARAATRSCPWLPWCGPAVAGDSVADRRRRAPSQRAGDCTAQPYLPGLTAPHTGRLHQREGRLASVPAPGSLQSEPAYAHLALIDALTASPKSASVAHDGLIAYAAMLEPGIGDREHEPWMVVAPEATASTLLELCSIYVSSERGR